MLPARWAPTGREKGGRWRGRELKAPSPRKPERWKPPATLTDASSAAKAEGGGNIVVAQGHHSARAAAGDASHCLAAVISSSSCLQGGEHGGSTHFPTKGQNEGESHCSLASFGICYLLLKRAGGPALPLLCHDGARQVAPSRGDLRFQSGLKLPVAPEPERHRALPRALTPPAGPGHRFRAQSAECRRSREGGESAGARYRCRARSFDLTSRLCPSVCLIVSHLLWK